MLTSNNIIIRLTSNNFRYDFTYADGVRIENAKIEFTIPDCILSVEFELACGQRYINIYRDHEFFEKFYIDSIAFHPRNIGEDAMYLVQAIIASDKSHPYFHIVVFENPEKNNEYILEVRAGNMRA